MSRRKKRQDLPVSVGCPNPVMAADRLLGLGPAGALAAVGAIWARQL